ncbi:ribonuclease H-like domain-containing protein [Tanacetum coccineum]
MTVTNNSLVIFLSDKHMTITNLATLVPVKLNVDEMNYSSWVYFFKNHCRGLNGVTSFIKYEMTDEVASSTPVPPTSEWVKIDSIILSWIFTTMSKTLQQRLKAELRSMKLGNLSIDAYFRKIEPIATILASLGSPISKDDIVNIVLDGLPVDRRRNDTISSPISNPKNHHLQTNTSYDPIPQNKPADEILDPTEPATHYNQAGPSTHVSTQQPHLTGPAITHHHVGPSNHDSAQQPPTTPIPVRLIYDEPTTPLINSVSVSNQSDNPNPAFVHPTVTRFRVGTNRPTEHLNLHVSSISPLPKSSLAGSLQYLTFTRPDISYAVQQETQRKHHPMFSRSSAEVEYRGVVNDVAETCWLRNLLRELHTHFYSARLIYCDNISVVYSSSNPVQHQRTKHTKIDIHFVRDLIAVGQVRVLHVSS